MPTLREGRWPLLVGLAGVLVYLDALPNGFALDDVALVERNPAVGSLANLGRIFTQPYWNVPGEKIDPGNLPSRAFDSEQQRVETIALLDEYNLALHVTPELDARFSALARERIRSHPLRYYAWLPVVRIADMWLRPRTELLPPDSRWYEFDDDTRWIVLAVGFGVLNLLYILAATAGLLRGSPIAWVGLGLSYIVLRSLFLGTLENPETRYTLECFPAVIVMASALLGGDD